MRLIPLAAACLLLPLGAAAQPAASPAPAAKPAAAQPAAAQPAPAKPSEAARKAALELNEKLQFTNQVNGILGNVRNQIILGLARSSSKPPEQVQPIVDELLMPDFVSHAKELGDDIVDHWASSFTVEELHGLRNFYGTPLGEKLLKTAPAIGQQVAKDGGAWVQGIFQQTIQTHADALRERGLTLPEDAAKKNAP
jgi:hypothetical protein